MTLQERMMLYRAAHRINQKELADMCGLSQMTICQVESGAQKPSKMTELKIRLVVGGGTNETVSE